MKVYLLYYDTDLGSREEWNTFYTPCEVFDSDVKREERIEFIESQVDQDGEPVDYGFYKIDLDMMTDVKAQEWE